MMISSDSIARINKALENSFGNIKRDMNELKDAVRVQNKEIIGLQSDGATLKSGIITKDKLDVLKIKVGELNENLKKIWDVEKNLKEVSERSVNRAFFEQAVDDLKSKIGQTNFKLGEVNKNYVSEDQVKEAISNINQEFNGVHQSIKEARAIKAGISMDDVERHTSRVAKKVDEFEKDINKFKKQSQNLVTVSQTKDLLDDLNKELDSLKRDVMITEKRTQTFITEAKTKSMIESIRKNLQKVDERSHGYVTENEVAKVVDDINKGFRGIKDKMALLDKENKTNIKEDEVKNLVDDLGKDFEVIRKDLRKVKEKGKGFASHAKINHTFDKLIAEIDDIRKENKNFITDAQIRGLVNDINKELGTFKDELEFIRELELDMKSIDKLYAKNQDIDKVSKNIKELKKEYAKNQEVVKLADQLDDVEQSIKRIETNYAETKNFNKLSRSVDEMKKDIKRLKSEFVSRKDYDQEMDAFGEDLKHINGRAILKELKPSKTIKKMKMKKKKGRKTMFFANFLIVIAFLMLIFSVVSYFVGEVALMDKSAIGAVGVFVIGIIIRMAVVLKRK
ncbi:hypothetical protein ACFLZ7_02400 [Nanoarchaeota archaeon]